jgi:hypothetical protein
MRSDKFLIKFVHHKSTLISVNAIEISLITTLLGDFSEPTFDSFINYGFSDWVDFGGF